MTSIWEQIDRLKAKHERELAEVRTEAVNLKASGEVHILTDGRWACVHRGKRYTARSGAELIAALKAVCS